MNKIPMTAEGYSKIQDELKKLTSEDRPNIIAAIAEARGHGDLSENAEYQYAKEQQSLIEGRISDLEINLIETGVDVGPAIYLARAFDTEIDTVVKFFIFVLIFVFDPLALSLVLAFNHMIERDEKEKDSIEKMYDMYSKKKFKRDIEKEKIDVEKKKVVKKEKPKMILKSRGGIKI